MRWLRFLFKVLLFFLLGEVMVRLDRHFLFFQGQQVEMVEIKSRASEELELLKGKKIILDSQSLRILVLGDSWIYGAGIESEKIATYKLKHRLSRELQDRYSKIFVFNAAMPSNNNLMHKVTYFNYVESFAPQVVLLAYNPNDVYGNQDEEKVRTEDSVTGPAPKNRNAKTDEGVGGAQQFRRFLNKSTLIGFLATKINMELKIKGFIIPGIEFHHQLYQAYLPDYKPWKKSQEHLNSIIEDCKKRNIFLLIYMVPELNMLNSYGVFSEQDALIESFFAKKGVAVVRGAGSFEGADPDDLALSRYDGHPNEKAHEQVAQHLYKALNDLYLKKQAR